MAIQRRERLPALEMARHRMAGPDDPAIDCRERLGELVEFAAQRAVVRRRRRACVESFGAARRAFQWPIPRLCGRAPERVEERQVGGGFEPERHRTLRTWRRVEY
jgi:hypothetical protein